MTLTTSDGTGVEIDTIDFDYLNRFRWYRGISPTSKTDYCMTSLYIGGRSVTTYMHRMIAIRLGWKIEGLTVDHKDFNGLNNQRHNLQVLTYSQNCIGRQGSELRVNNTSGITGVSWRPESNNWRARIFLHGANISLGSFDNFEEAVLARYKAEQRHLKCR